MIEFKIKNFLIIFKKNFINLSIIDIIIFSFFVNTNYLYSFPKILKISISVFLIQSTILNYTHTKFIEPIFLISGAKIKKLVIINFWINNIIFLLISFLLVIIKKSNIIEISENFYILNSLILISFILKFIIPFKNIEYSFIRKSIILILFYFLFSLTITGLKAPFVGSLAVLTIFFITINYFNRSLNLNDNN